MPEMYVGQEWHERAMAAEARVAELEAELERVNNTGAVRAVAEPLEAEVEKLREQLRIATELGPLYRKWQETAIRAEKAEADRDRLKERELDDDVLEFRELEAQRDRLAEALRELEAYGRKYDRGRVESIARSALASLEEPTTKETQHG